MRQLLVALTATATVMAATPDVGTAKPATPKAREKARTACKTLTCKRRVGHKITLRRWKKIIAPYRMWLRGTRLCESSGNYGTNTGNSFYGAYQFTLNTWRSVGGRGMPHLAPRLEQDYRAVLVRFSQGTGAWPVCG
jgi:hypothetical protein